MIITAAELMVTIGGTDYPRARLVQARQALLPDVGAATLRLPIGTLLDPADATPQERWAGSILPRAAVRLAFAGDGAPAWVWTGEVIDTEEVGGPAGCELAVECVGPAAALARFALTTVWWRQTQPTIAWVLAELAPYNAGGGNRALAGRPECNLFTVDDDAVPWDQAQAIQHQLDLAHMELGAPRFDLDWSLAAQLDQIDVWDTRGLSVLESALQIVGVRSSHALRVDDSGATPRLVPVDLWAASEDELDLTRAEVASYRLTRDGAATMESMRVIANGWTRVLTATWTRDGSRTEQAINPLWSVGDEAAPASAANLAFRAWELGVLPARAGWCTDGARLADGLPIVVSRAGDAVAPWLSAPIRVFVQRRWGWEDWTGRVTVHCPSPTVLQVVGGVDWVEVVKECTAVAFTIAVHNGIPSQVVRSGGSGVGSPRIDVVNHEVRIDAGTATRVSDKALVPTEAVDTNLVDLDAQADRLWPPLREDRIRLTWTEAGYGDAIAIGARYGSVRLPGDRTVAIPGGVVVGKTLSVDPIPSVTCSIDLPTPSVQGTR